MERDPLIGLNLNIIRTLIPNTLINTWNSAMNKAEERADSDGMISMEDTHRLHRLEQVGIFFGIDVYKW